MELGGFGTQELIFAGAGLLLVILLIVVVVASRRGGDDAEASGSTSISNASRDELIERAVRAETERDIFRATVKRLRAENERLHGGGSAEETDDVGTAPPPPPPPDEE